MKRMMRYFIPAAAALVILSGCNSAPTTDAGGTTPTTTTASNGKKLRIGVSLPAGDHGWTAGAVWWAKEAMKLYPDVEFDLQTADKPDKQVADIETMMTKGVDAVVILATESAPLTPVAKQAHEKGILVVNVDRGFTEPVADIFIEGDNKAFGRKSAEFMVQKLGGKGNIVILEGLPSTVNTDRVSSALEVFKGSPDIKILAQQPGKWNKDEAKNVMDTLLQKFPQIDAVWAADDDMAEGVELSMKAANRSEFWILGGAGKKETVKKVMDKDALYPADITYPPSMTALAIQNAVGVLKAGKEKVLKFTPKHMKIDVEMITPDNAKDYYFPDSTF